MAEGYPLGGGRESKERKVQRSKGIIGRYKMDSRRLRIIQEMETLKNSHA